MHSSLSMDTNEQQSGYISKSIVFVKSNFSRERIIDFTQEFNHNIDVKVEVGDTPGKLIVSTLFFHYSSVQNGKTVMALDCEITSSFEKIGTPSVTEEEFARINAPSIMFPFVREHLASLSLKAGFNAILLPPFNFSALAKKANG